MSDQPPIAGEPGMKVEPDELTLRARPRPVTRLNRKVLMTLAAGASLAILGATFLALALDPPRIGDREGAGELYNVDRKPTAEGLAALPRSYQEMPPRLGPPLPGDLGATIRETERQLGVAELPQAGSGFLPDPMEDALRAERLRQARKAEQAREAGVLFQINPRQSAPTTGAPDGPAVGGDLAALLAAQPSDEPALDLGEDQNRQRRKLAFLARDTDPDIYNPHALQDPASPFQVMAGTIIAASLVTGINSDLPGQIIAQVTENVYDTVTGRHLLIPQGSRLIGTYDSVVAFGQSRALVVWNRIVMPDGSSIVIDNLPATDTAGYAGLEDEVDFHSWRLIKGVVLSTLLGVGTELTFSESESDLVRALRESAQSSANQAGQEITRRNLDIQPTITVRPGWPLRIIVNKDIVFRRPYRG